MSKADLASRGAIAQAQSGGRHAGPGGGGDTQGQVDCDSASKGHITLPHASSRTTAPNSVVGFMSCKWQLCQGLMLMTLQRPPEPEAAHLQNATIEPH